MRVSNYLFNNKVVTVYNITCASAVTSSITELAKAITFDSCWTLTTVSTGTADNSCMMFDLIYVN